MQLFLSFLVFCISALSLPAYAKCIDKKDYDKLPAKWVAVNPLKNNIAAERNWPPENQEVLFYFAEPRLQGPVRGEFNRFRFGRVQRTGCYAILTGRNLDILFPLLQLSNYEPSHWMPLTYVDLER